MSDGSIVFSTKVDNVPAEKELARIERDIERFKKKHHKVRRCKAASVKTSRRAGSQVGSSKEKT